MSCNYQTQTHRLVLTVPEDEFCDSQQTTSITVTGLNSQALTPNPIFSLKCLLKDFCLISQLIWATQNLKQKFPRSVSSFSKNKHLQTGNQKRESQETVSCSFSSVVASLSSFSLFHGKNYNCQGSCGLFNGGAET